MVRLIRERKLRSFRLLLVAMLAGTVVAEVRPAQAYTAELCTGLVIRAAVAVFPPNLSDQGIEQPLENGDRPRGYKMSVVALLINHRTGSRLFCDLRGGECLPEESVRLLNCSVGNAVTQEGVTDVYSTVLNRAAIPKTELRESELEDELMIRFSICHACAGLPAYVYIHRPESLCARLIRSALEGDSDATARVFPVDGSGPGRRVNARICH